MAFNFDTSTTPAATAGSAPAAPAAPAGGGGGGGGGFSFFGGGIAAPAPGAPAAAPGAPAAAPAATGGGFSFGGAKPPAAAPAAPGAAPAPAPAPAAGAGFSFGGSTSTTAPSAPAASAPAPSAPAAAGGTTNLFGAPAPGAAAAPAPTAGGFGTFGSAPAAPAPATTAGFGGFGSTPAAPAPFGSPQPAFANAQTPAQQQQAQQAQQQQQQQAQPITGHTPYTSLPLQARRAVDEIHGLMMRHRKTLATVEVMAPALLITADNAATVPIGGGGIRAGDVAAGSPARRPPLGATIAATTAAASGAAAAATSASTTTNTTNIKIDPTTTPLPIQIAALSSTIATLSTQIESCLSTSTQLKNEAAKLAASGIAYGAWPIEALAVRRNVPLSALSTRPGTGGAASTKSMGQTDLEYTLDHLLSTAASNVDRIERLPSPYLWEVLQELEGRAQDMGDGIESLSRQLYVAELARGVLVGGVVGAGGEGQVPAIGSAMGGGPGVAAGGMMLPPLGSAVAMTTMSAQQMYAYPGDGAAGTAHAAAATLSPPQSVEEELSTVARQQSDAFIRVAAAVARSHDMIDELRARCRRLAGAGGAADPFARADAMEAEEERRVQERIRSEVAAAAGAAAAAGTIAAPATAPGAGAGAPAPAAGGGLFGTTPAPAPAGGGGFFGSAAPAPAAPAPAFGSFGASTTPAAAPAAAGTSLFGAPAAAPAAGTSLFGPPFGAPAPAASTSTVRSKSKTRSSRRR